MTATAKPQFDGSKFVVGIVLEDLQSNGPLRQALGFAVRRFAYVVGAVIGLLDSMRGTILTLIVMLLPLEICCPRRW